MKHKHMLLALTGLMAVSAATLVRAGDPAEAINLFDITDQKQTSKDFKPAPARIDTNFGALEFSGGAFPTQASAQKIYDEMDRQRATQAYMDFYPAQWFEDRLKVYPLATGPRKTDFVNASRMGANTLVPEDGSAFAMLNEIIQYEPADLFSMEQRGRLATLGIEKGKPFAPDARMQKIFDQAAKQGVAMSRAILYASRAPDIKYWPERQWEKMFLHNTEFTRNGYTEIDARTLWHYQAIVVSPNLLSTTPGVGTAYLTAFRDKAGAYLMGDRDYRLRVPANPPVKRFWAVTAYDPTSRSLLDSGGKITVGSMSAPQANADGSVDVYFGPQAPAGKAGNWIKTDPAKGFFVVFRFYGPLEGYIDKTWVMNDFERID